MRQSIDDIKMILESIPEYFHILESKTDWNIHNDYIRLTEKLYTKKYNENELIHECEKLFQDKIPIDLKKELLIRLAHLETVESYRILEKFYNNCDNELKTWAALALQECYMSLENYLMDSNSGFISTGLGGKDNNLRFFFVIFTTTSEPFTELQKKLICDEFELICKKSNSELEKIDFDEDYSCLTILMPMDIAPDTIIMDGINICNELGDFIIPHYFVTNVEIPSKEEILRIIKEMRIDI